MRKNQVPQVTGLKTWLMYLHSPVQELIVDGLNFLYEVRKDYD